MRNAAEGGQKEIKPFGISELIRRKLCNLEAGNPASIAAAAMVGDRSLAVLSRMIEL